LKMVDQCTFAGNSDMYGLGIRLGYYLQWFGVIVAGWIVPGEVEGLRMANSLFVAATFLALLVQVGKNLSPQDGGLETVEIYIILLLTFGSSFAVVPALLWRFITKFDPEKDPTRWSGAPPQSKTFNYLYMLLLIAVFSLQIWFWTTRVTEAEIPGCTSWAFFLSRVRLQSPGVRWISLCLSIMLIFCLVTLLGVNIHDDVTYWLQKHGLQDRSASRRRSSTPVKRLSRRKKAQLARQNTILNSAMKLATAIITVTAVELAIWWNQIMGVQSVGPAGQTIPLVLGLSAVLGVFYSYFWPSEDKDNGRQTGRSPNRKPGHRPHKRPSVVVRDRGDLPRFRTRASPPAAEDNIRSAARVRVPTSAGRPLSPPRRMARGPDRRGNLPMAQSLDSDSGSERRTNAPSSGPPQPPFPAE
jgi:hypothetical protein